MPMAASTSIVGTLTPASVGLSRPSAASAKSATRLLPAAAAAAMLSVAGRTSAGVLLTQLARATVPQPSCYRCQSIRHAPVRGRAPIRGTWRSGTI